MTDAKLVYMEFHLDTMGRGERVLAPIAARFSDLENLRPSTTSRRPRPSVLSRLRSERSVGKDLSWHLRNQPGQVLAYPKIQCGQTHSFARLPLRSRKSQMLHWHENIVASFIPMARYKDESLSQRSKSFYLRRQFICVDNVRRAVELYRSKVQSPLASSSMAQAQEQTPTSQ